MSYNNTIDLSISRSSAPIRAQVVDVLRRAIVNRELTAGQPLVEQELCRQTGASRTSVREALRELEAMGLVATTPYKGTAVATVTAEQARDIYEVRMLLEGLAGRLFALRASEAEIAELRAVMDEVGRAQRGRDHEQLLQAKERFYAVLLRGSGNREIEHILGGLLARITVLRSATLSVRGRPAKSLRELRRIAAAIEARDGEATEQACREHVRNAASAAGIKDLDP